MFTNDLDNAYDDFASNDQTDFLDDNPSKYNFSQMQSDQIRE